MRGELPRPMVMDPRSFLGVLLRRKYGFVLILGLSVAAAIYLSYHATPIFSSTAEVQVLPPNPSQAFTSNTGWIQANMDNEVHIVKSGAVAHIAIEKLGKPAGPDSSLSVSVPTNTHILDITYSDPDPATAQAGALAYAQAYQQYRRETIFQIYEAARREFQIQIDDLRQRLQTAQATLNAAAAGSNEQQVAQGQVPALSSRIAGLTTQLASLTPLQFTAATIIQTPQIPTTPSSPDHPFDVALGFAGGSFLAIWYASVRDRIDDRIRGRRSLESASGIPNLAEIPRVKHWRKRKHQDLAPVAEPNGVAAEGYRTLRTNLQFVDRSEDVRVIAITSPNAGEGRSTTAANFAVSLAQSGRRVVAVSADLRRPRLHELFELDNEIGLTSILSGSTPAAEAIRKIFQLPLLRVLPSGPLPPNPAEVLSSDEFGSVLAQLRGFAEYVVIDTAPVLPVTDALVVAPRADAVVLVVGAFATRRGAARRAVDALEQVNAKVIGTVLNEFDPKKARFDHRYRSANGSPYRLGYRSAEEALPADPSLGNGGRPEAVRPEGVRR
jgi:polysaccharide biosynthesis transport protein